LDDVDLGAANPWGVTCTPDGKCVCVAHAGTHEVSVIDRAGLHEKLNKVAAGQGVSEVSATAADVPNDLAFLVGLRRRVVLGGNGPRGIVVIGRTLYAAEYFSDAVGVVDLDPASRRQAKSIPLGPRKRLSAARKGEMFFNDASLCFQHWQSCASCHPDGRADGLNWDLLNDGLGNPKNTKSLLLSHKTPPAMSLGVRDKAEAAVRAGIKSIQFAVRPEEDAAAIDAYCQSLEPVPSPYRAKGTPAAAKRGQRTFQQAGCASCHLAPLYTDRKSYDAGTGKEVDSDRKFDTPTLVEVWRTAPYLHDGRAATMKELLTRHNPGDRHGVTTGLSEAELEDLAAFILAQ
jgi:mono/diheme cytochrome c family protein